VYKGAFVVFGKRSVFKNGFGLYFYLVEELKFKAEILETFLSNLRIKVTLRITGLLSIRAHINFGVWHLDVGSNSR